jgi:putative DNA primase/helicase
MNNHYTMIIPDADTEQQQDSWLTETVSMAIEQGHRPIPMVNKNQPAGGFKDGQTYQLTDKLWKTVDRTIIGIALDDFILVDYDGNKPKGALPLAELFATIGDEPSPIQENDKGDSMHYLYRIPTGIDKGTLKHSNIDWLHGVDVLTMNQLMHLKQRKVIPDGELPTLKETPDAPQAIIDALTKVTGESLQARSDSPAGKLKSADVLTYINPNCTYSEWLSVGMGLHHEFNGDALGLEVWDNWSAEGEKYPGWSALEYKWKSFSNNVLNSQITIGTLCEMAKDNGADLSAIAKKYDENGELLPTIEEILQQAAQLTLESDINSVLKYYPSLPAIPRRRLLTAIKKSTDVPFSTLKDAIKEGLPESKEPDQLALAQQVVKAVGKENVIAAQSFVWAWEQTGVWRKQEERSVRQYIHEVVPPLVEAAVTKNMIDGVTDLFKTEIFCPQHEFDVGEPESVNCLNGELTLFEEGEVWSLDDHNREHFRTTQIPVKHDYDAQAPRFVQFMAEVFADDADADDKIKALLEMMGYTLMAHCRHERFIILIGTGANGKSVLLSVLEALCGSINVAGVQPSQFDNKFQRAHLHGKLANIVTEVEQGATIADAALKGIVSGEPTTVEHKHKDPFMMRPFSTCWFGTNHMPHTRDFSDALFRRALVVTFNNAFKPEFDNCDPMLKEKLLDELPGVLNLALAAYASAVDSGFTIPMSSEQARVEWRMEADQVAQFVDEQCERDKHSLTPIGDVYTQYKEWAYDNGIKRPLGKKSVRDRLTRLGFGDKRASTTRYVTGLKLRIPEPANYSSYERAKNLF